MAEIHPTGQIADAVQFLRSSVRAGISIELALPLIEEPLRLPTLEAFNSQRIPIAQADTIVGVEPHENWSETFISSQGPLWRRLQHYLSEVKNRNDSEIASLDESSDRILYLLGNPKGTNFDRRGLTVGYVQSGKTANYTALSAKAFDSGYRLVIVLTGMHNSLRRQTQLRMERELGVESDSHDSPTAGDFGEPNTPPVHRLTSADLVRGDHIPSTISRSILTEETTGRFLIITKKNSSVLKRLSKWLGPSIDVPTLIIDDEADQASVNTAGNRSLLPSEANPDYSPADEEPAVINGLIRELRSKFTKISYVAYTATPFANVFIQHDAKDLVVNDDLYPRDFIISLPKPKGYLGPEEFFGSAITGNATEFDHVAASVIQVVPEGDAGKIASLNPYADNGDSLPSSLKMAIRYFLLAVCARRLHDGAIAPCSMLVHASALQAEQKILRDAIESYLSGLRHEWRWLSSTDNKVRESWRDDWEMFSADMIDDSFRMDSETILQALGDVLGRYHSFPVLLLNNSSADELDYELEPNLNAIVVGGNKLSRGLTLEGLLVSYFIRASRSPNADTLLQMGRFFGYSLKRLPITRIFTTASLRDDFRETAAMELMLRNEIARYARVKLTPKDFAPRVLQTRIRPTARNKMKSVISTGESYTGNLIQTTSFIAEEQIQGGQTKHNLHNLNLTTELLSGLSGDSRNSVFFPETPKTKYVFSNIEATTVVSYLRRFLTGQSNTRFRPNEIANYIEDLNQVGELAQWSIALVGRTFESTLGKFEFGDGLCVGRISRALDKDSERSIGQLINPIKLDGSGLATGDEVVDFTTVELEKINHLRAEFPQITLAESSRQVRPSDRGLLLIYPISPASIGKRGGPEVRAGKDTNRTLGEALFHRTDIDQTIVGLAMVFPHAKVLQPREYWQGTAGRAI